MPKIMQSISTVIPVTYAADALRGVIVKGFSFGPIASPLGILLLFNVLSIGSVLILFKRNIE
jgi:ABC-2 type transport system permease protein